MIRPYAPADTGRIVSIWQAASALATPFLEPAFLAREADNIRRLYLPVAETWVCVHAGMPVGFMSLLGDEVGALFVHPAEHGGGHGRALMDQAVALRGSVYLDVFEDNAIGRRFYEGYGFGFDRAHVHEETGFLLHRLTYPPGTPAAAAG